MKSLKYLPALLLAFALPAMADDAPANGSADPNRLPVQSGTCAFALVING